MLLKLFLLFTILPSFELWLLFQVKAQLGLMETIWLVLLTGIVGASMAKRQGFLVIQELQKQTNSGQMPGQTAVEGLLVLIGGVLLITPGILTDAFGFSLIIPFTRKLWAPIISKQFKGKMSNGTFTVRGGPINTTNVTNTTTDEQVVILNSDANQKNPSRSFSHPEF